MKNLSLKSNISSKEYKNLLNWLGKHSQSFALILREPKKSSEAMKFIESLGKYLIKTEMVSEWPGTKLIGSEAKRSTFKATDEAIKILLASSDSLSSWIEPDLPEDLSFFNASGTELLVSITHENDFWLSLDSNQEKEFVSEFKSLIES